VELLLGFHGLILQIWRKAHCITFFTGGSLYQEAVYNIRYSSDSIK